MHFFNLESDCSGKHFFAKIWQFSSMIKKTCFAKNCPFKVCDEIFLGNKVNIKNCTLKLFDQKLTFVNDPFVNLSYQKPPLSCQVPNWKNLRQNKKYFFKSEAESEKLQLKAKLTESETALEECREYIRIQMRRFRGYFN